MSWWKSLYRLKKHKNGPKCEVILIKAWFFKDVALYKRKCLWWKMFIYQSITIISVLFEHAFPFVQLWFLIVLKETWGRRAEMRLVTCYNGKDKSGQDGAIINVQWSRPDQQIWKTVKLSLFAVQLNNTPSLQNTIEIKTLILSLSLSIIETKRT